MSDPLANLDPWLNDDLVEAAQAIVDGDQPDNEQDRNDLCRWLGEDLHTIGLAASQLRLLREEWHAERHADVAAFKAGCVELRREEYELVKTRNLFHAALGRLRMTHERKAARAALVDAALECVDACESIGFASESYERLLHAANGFKASAA